MRFQLLIITFIFFTSCTQKVGPEKTLNEFINYRFEKSQNKSDLLKMTTGTLKERIEQFSDSELSKFLDSKKLIKKKVKVLNKSCENEVCHLTYIVGYLQESKSSKDSSFKVEVKKIAKLEKADNKWKLADVSNIKTYIESNKQLKVESEESSKP